MNDTTAPPARAADGLRLPPAANSFGEFIRFLEDGQLDATLVEALRDLRNEMANVAIESGGKAKGKMTLTLDFALEGRVFTIGASHKVAIPEAKRPKSVMWSTEDGRFTPSNPQQDQLFGVREVGSPGFRDVG
ncbi:hypothetical protein GO308_12760 [Sphingomonas sp. SFZ2018-12]|uniref:hypothetical protein n=1 Tax=Sphingomonas sp. SFZ2018-12 TaxID=2683197 RepID=UPI001F0D9A0B|nr:hypothetical protein [Sphingomonas sp. SFZ2018-12]MCH4893986.1 hypothetical protein [Sphingomonas sp. SFZ2018-12]